MKIIIKIISKLIRVCVEVVIVYNIFNILTQNMGKFEKLYKDKLYYDIGSDF